MMSVSRDAAGWTVITPPRDARVVYVSSSRGSDANSGLSASAPVKSLARAASLVRNRSGDQMLLRRGDTWRETLGMWTKSGRSHDEPLVIGAYGAGERPTLATGNRTALTTGRQSVPRVDHLALVGVRFYADARDPASRTYSGTTPNPGLRIVSATDDLLVEDCVVQGYATNIVLGKYFGDLTNVTVRRSVIIDAYANTTYAQGLYATDVHGLLLEENVFDHNGWNARVPGARANMHNHNIYLRDDTSGVVVRGNLIANAASHGLQARSGGVVEGNTFLNNPIGMSFGHVNGSPVTEGGVSGAVRDNVFLGGGTIDGSRRGQGLEIGNTRPGANVTVSGNVFAHNEAGPGFAVNLNYGSGVENPWDAVGINDLTIRENVVYEWSRGLTIMEDFRPGRGQKGVSRLSVRDNDFQELETPFVLHVPGAFGGGIFSGNEYHASGGTPHVSSEGRSIRWTDWSRGHETGGRVVRVGYPDPERTAGSYAGRLGLKATDGGFVLAARGQGRGDWDPDLTGRALAGYVRAGFRL